MPYFNEFPYIRYQFPDDNIRLIKNLSIRPAVVNDFFDERSNFETYTIQDGDTPETLSYDIFGETELHWTIMLPNNILNLYEDWPKTTNQFDAYLISKYKEIYFDSHFKIKYPSTVLTDTHIRQIIEFKGVPETAYRSNIQNVMATPHHFEDADGNIYPYDSVVDRTTMTTISNYNDAWGRTFNRPAVEPVSIFEYETELNEAKRNILIPKFAVAQRMKAQLRDLVNA